MMSNLKKRLEKIESWHPKYLPPLIIKWNLSSEEIAAIQEDARKRGEIGPLIITSYPQTGAADTKN
jgi:hypothetical protein